MRAACLAPSAPIARQNHGVDDTAAAASSRRTPWRRVGLPLGLWAVGACLWALGVTYLPWLDEPDSGRSFQSALFWGALVSGAVLITQVVSRRPGGRSEGSLD